jgi:hypothetical protein
LLAVQEYLKTHTLLELAEKGISVNWHPNGKLIILNYDQLEAKKLCPVSRNCRGLVLEYPSFNIVARAFDRFFNLGEVPELNDTFNWKEFSTQEKCDGSLILAFKYDGQTFVNTRNSWGDGVINGSEYTWRKLFGECIDIETMFDGVDCQTLVFELCSIYNKVVTHYSKPQVFLLSAFTDEKEHETANVDVIAVKKGWTRPLSYVFKNKDDVALYIKDLESCDPTAEGVVIRDDKNLRIKIKNLSWFNLARLKDNNNIFLPKYLVPLILTGEISEILIYLDELRPHVDKLEPILKQEHDNLIQLWNEYKHIENQKEFALKVVSNSKFSGLLFIARKTGRCPSELWRESAGLIVKTLF